MSRRFYLWGAVVFTALCLHSPSFAQAPGGTSAEGVRARNDGIARGLSRQGQAGGKMSTEAQIIDNCDRKGNRAKRRTIDSPLLDSPMNDLVFGRKRDQDIIIAGDVIVVNCDKTR